MPSTPKQIESRFVLLRHEYPLGHERTSHWDLMLEQDGKLLTWALSKSLQPGTTIAAQQLPDHRIEYLDYEGPVSRGRGSVSRVLKGNYRRNTESGPQVVVLQFDSHGWKIQFRSENGRQVQIEVSEIDDR